MQKFPSQVSCRINGLLFKAVEEIAKMADPIEWSIDKNIENVFEARNVWFDYLKEIINSFDEPVIVSNITIYSLFDMFFKKNITYKYKNDSYFIANEKTFEVYVDSLLPSSLDYFVIFDANNPHIAKLIKYEPSLIL